MSEAVSGVLLTERKDTTRLIDYIHILLSHPLTTFFFSLVPLLWNYFFLSYNLLCRASLIWYEDSKKAIITHSAFVQ